MTDEIRSIHFIGICGTAMASVAAAMKRRGVHVTGSDQNAYPPMSTFLEEQGIEVMTPYAESNLDPLPDLVVVGNAISRGNPEAELVLEKKVRFCSLPELLRERFIRGKRSIVVAGTHGKTTTTSILAWVFEHNGLNPSFLIGGIPENFGCGARFTDSEWFIIEGDEYDTAFFDKRGKFIQYLPEVAIINHLEFDHADIFPDLQAIQTSFSHFIRLVPRNGLLLANGDAEGLLPLLEETHCSVQRFGFDDSNDVTADDCHYDEGGSEFTLGNTKFRIPMFGALNVRNTMAVALCARHCGLTDEQIQGGFDTFKGIKRRQEIRGEARGMTIIDDFGHHPTAIEESIIALRGRFPGRRLWAIFEPRSNTTRRNVFQSELAFSLAQADIVVVAEVARLEQLAPTQRLDPAKLMHDIESAGADAHYIASVDDIVARVEEDGEEGDVVCVFSNGGFGGIHKKLLAIR